MPEHVTKGSQNPENRRIAGPKALPIKPFQLRPMAEKYLVHGHTFKSEGSQLLGQTLHIALPNRGLRGILVRTCNIRLESTQIKFPLTAL